MGIIFSNTTSNEINDVLISLFNHQGPNRISSRDADYINEIFVNNGFDPIESQAQQIKERTKRAKTYEAPIMIKRSEIKIEKDGLEPSLFYITFNYCSIKPFDCAIYLNAEENFSSNNALFKQSDPFANHQIRILNVPIGKEQTFFEKEACFNAKYFHDKKTFDKLFNDIIIECSIYNKEKKKIDYVLATYCKILKSNDNYQLKSEMQKVRVRNVWFDMREVYGLEDNDNCNNECEVCYTNKKNTIFLPCMHSYSCNDCSVYVRLRGNKCPLCRESKFTIV